MLEVIEASGVATVQDQGRFGWRRFGVPTSGPMDAIAYATANMLAGNPAEAGVVEIGGGDLLLRAAADCAVAVTGAGFKLTIGSWDYPLWGSYFVRSGWTIQLEKDGFGMWAYVAVAGGIDVAPVMGSRSTCMRGRFGGVDGRRLEEGDALKTAATGEPLMEIAGRSLKQEAQPAYGPGPTVDVILGPQSDRFGDESLGTLLSSAYKIGLSSDRMGYRLEGAKLPHRGSPDITSEGMTAGSIQVPADGAPIVMMADGATTGGYPKIACVTRADLPRLAQCTPGRDEVRFRETSIEMAQARWRDMMQRLQNGIVESDEGAGAMGAA